jgi:hypothetical protein
MTANDFAQFLKDDRHEVEVNIELAADVIAQINREKNKHQGPADLSFGLSKSEFAEFLLSTRLNNIINQEKTIIKEEDMNLPLPNYLCFSSHNTYLSGN